MVTLMEDIAELTYAHDLLTIVGHQQLKGCAIIGRPDVKGDVGRCLCSTDLSLVPLYRYNDKAVAWLGVHLPH
jgi:hypothetical protein